MITIVEAIYAIQVIVTVTKVSKASQKLKELVHKVAPDTIRDQLAEYVRCLKEGTNTSSLAARSSICAVENCYTMLCICIPQSTLKT